MRIKRVCIQITFFLVILFYRGKRQCKRREEGLDHILKETVKGKNLALKSFQTLTNVIAALVMNFRNF